MSAAISAGYVSSDSRAAPRSEPAFSLNWIIRDISPYAAVHSSRYASSVCAGTTDWRNSVASAPSPQASRVAASSRVSARSCAGS